jgi:hypothetical protein
VANVPNIKSLRALAGAYTESNIKILAGFASGPEVPAALRIQAIGMLLDRAHGKCAQPVTGENGEGDIRLTIRNIIEEKQRKS